MSTGYGDIIIAATGCSENDVEAIEQIMRDVIFHSTLDWQTRIQLERAARLAHSVFRQGQQPAREHRSRRQRTILRVDFELAVADYRALEPHIWNIADAIPGLQQCQLGWVPGCGYYLTLSGSRRAVVRAARMVNITEDQIRPLL
jgi:hypothetical protein